MKVLNDWRFIKEFELHYKGQVWCVKDVGYGISVCYWNDYDEIHTSQTDMPVPKFYESRRNGDKHSQDLEWFSPGFYNAIHSSESEIYIVEV